jgi:hypothetical protein
MHEEFSVLFSMENESGFFFFDYYAIFISVGKFVVQVFWRFVLLQTDLRVLFEKYVKTYHLT